MPNPPSRTNAHVGAHQIDTRGLVETRVVLALILVLLTVIPGESTVALTSVETLQVNTSGVMLTWTLQTFVDVLTTIISGPSSLTRAEEGTLSICASTTIETRRLGQAFINILFTVLARPPSLALALVRPWQVRTSSAVYARKSLAFVDVKLTCFSSPTNGTRTCKGALSVQTSGSIFALVWCIAFVDIRLAVYPDPAWSADTRVRSIDIGAR